VGYGDWILATGQVKKLHTEHSKAVCVIGFNGRVQWSDVFENNPKILRKMEAGCLFLKNAGGCRPYILAKGLAKWVWKDWEIAPGEVYLSDAEQAFAEPYRGKVLIEPTTKVPNGNKAWPWERWQGVVDRTGFDFIQVGPVNTPVLRGVSHVATTFRQAMAVLSVCKAYVGPEGALHHAAAALNVPAVVLWSHFIHPRFTGYASQRNLRHANGWCGSRLPCNGCKQSMSAISVDEVAQNLGEIV
jgi:ADP-heptose:LPS heptosyltransferase